MLTYMIVSTFSVYLICSLPCDLLCLRKHWHYIPFLILVGSLHFFARRKNLNLCSFRLSPCYFEQTLFLRDTYRHHSLFYQKLEDLFYFRHMFYCYSQLDQQIFVSLEDDLWPGSLFCHLVLFSHLFERDLLERHHPQNRTLHYHHTQYYSHRHHCHRHRRHHLRHNLPYDLQRPHPLHFHFHSNRNHH